MTRIAPIIVLTILSILVAGFSACSGTGEIPRKPEDTNLEFWITQDVSEVDFSGYREIYGWFGARQYYGSGYLPVTDENRYEADENGYEADPEYYVKYLVSAWPDYADGGKYVTCIEFTDPEITVFGLTVDSSFDEFEKVFSGMGCEIFKESSDSFERITASKKRIRFSLESYEGKREFIIKAEVTNKNNIQF
jgi:hypothetical protein